MTDLRQAAQQALEFLMTRRMGAEAVIESLNEALAREHAMHELARLGQEIEQQQAEPCIGKDPRCPCRDGDACHYKDCVGTKARPVPQPAQEPVAWLKEDWTGGHLNYESVYGGAFAAFPVYKHPPAAQPEQEPVADGNKVICPACCHQFRAIPTAVQTLMLNAGFEPPFVTPPAPQRPWVGLTEDEKFEIAAAQYGWEDLLIAAEAKLKERNT